MMLSILSAGSCWDIDQILISRGDLFDDAECYAQVTYGNPLDKKNGMDQ
jgi:hypothetical protein